MPFLEVNGANLYYETFGQDRPDRKPIVLIHGSTGTGRSNWSVVAPILAREYRVIVPDCRGHGQSRNPNRTYSFKEMAADTAALIRGLGYERAHLIGHSNGGNVVLVALIEHLAVVQTCIPQAANAYVSADLSEKEPSIFDPDRVGREAPDWMNAMIALHGATHGPDYWRDLLRLTVQEIISQPNYTPDDLAMVKRPVLVIQGENDRVNAPGRHAQFIADNIPDAELWLPVGTGHTVHDERLFEWIDRVRDFLSRRGDDANDALYRLRRARYADERETVFDVRLTPSPSPNRGGVLSGRVLTPDQHQAALSVLGRPVKDEVKVLLTESTPWTLVNRNVAAVRREPGSSAELITQALVGESARILEDNDEWARVRLDRDGYLGWMPKAALHVCRGSEVAAYHAAYCAIVVAELACASLTPIPSPNQKLGEGMGWRSRGGGEGKLPFGATLPVIDRRDGFAAVQLPDGQVGWVAESDLLPLSDRPKPDAQGIAFTLNLIRRTLGTPYVWGGRSPFGYDCSGLAQTMWAFMGVIIPRDADQQFRAGKVVEGAPQPGDLLFFGETSPQSPPFHEGDARGGITHVAISLGGDNMIHANGAAGGVSYNSLDPANPVYRAWLKEHLAGVRRFADGR